MNQSIIGKLCSFFIEIYLTMDQYIWFIGAYQWNIDWYVFTLKMNNEKTSKLLYFLQVVKCGKSLFFFCQNEYNVKSRTHSMYTLSNDVILLQIYTF